MANIESDFLSAAKDGSLKLRISLSNGDRLNGVVSDFSRFDISIDAGAGQVPFSKKDIVSLSYSEPLVEPGEPEDATDEAQRRSRSRMQDEFLARYIKEKPLALINMTNGGSMRGVVTGYDGFTVLIKAGQGQVLAYKHGIISIGPGYRRN